MWRGRDWHLEVYGAVHRLVWDDVRPHLCPPVHCFLQAHLEHAAACDMDSRASQLEQENLVPVDEIEKRCMGQIRKMTLGGVRPHLIYRCVAEEMKPYKLGPQGARKV